MSRGFGFLALVGAGAAAIMLLTGAFGSQMLGWTAQVTGPWLPAGVSPIGVTYAVLGIFLGFSMAQLMRYSWLDTSRRVVLWILGQRSNVMLAFWGCVFGAVLLFY